MLVFSRRKGQRIVISNEIEIIVTHTSRATVKIAVRAPARCSVLRGEVFDSIVEANRAAAESPLEPGTEPSAQAADGSDESQTRLRAAEPDSEPSAKPAPAEQSASVSTL
jgi:carbon storage regulator